MSNTNQQLRSASCQSNHSASASLLSISPTSTSNSCPRCSDKLYLPPPIEALKSAVPSVSPSTVNRSIPRCVQCDKVSAERDAYSAEFPPPTELNPVAELESKIIKIKSLIALNVKADEMKIALAVAEQRKSDTEKERDKGIKRAWDGFRSVWGPLR
ncbi:hypothetical protein O988_03434 [Pseudogymnoascus sp. VKM F-3808]|nr:hypothetical protein O988_03434 [Pseudogymnoascus sp. VKM F-3808]